MLRVTKKLVNESSGNADEHDEAYILFPDDCGVALGVNISTIPILSEWGLIAMAGLLGIIGLLVIRSRKLRA